MYTAFHPDAKVIIKSDQRLSIWVTQSLIPSYLSILHHSFLSTG